MGYNRDSDEALGKKLSVYAKLETTDNRPEVDLNKLLHERVESGIPLIVIEPEMASSELVKTLRNMLPDEDKNKVTFINLDEPTKS
ncbi:hypothetical protein [Vibrio parahaemolyticus]|uniref:hypothetical protein n=1 Tax=Vibrio parahaemolyticus TaxID=670 RepID=UPI001E3EC2DB|nr:hypothetical protein [Vibrio parahaemolyticus]